MRTITYEQLVAQLQELGVDLSGSDRGVAARITAYEGESVAAIVRWITAAGRAEGS